MIIHDINKRLYRQVYTINYAKTAYSEGTLDSAAYLEGRFENLVPFYMNQPPVQIDKTIDALLEHAKAAAPLFNHTLGVLMRAHIKSFGGEFFSSSIKAKERIIEKVADEKNGDITQIMDPVRGAIVFDTMENMMDFIMSLNKSRSIFYGLRFDFSIRINQSHLQKYPFLDRAAVEHQADGTLLYRPARHRKDSFSGYMDAKTYVGIGGITCEVQLHIRDIWDIYDVSHKLYNESRRNVEDCSVGNSSIAGNEAKSGTEYLRRSIHAEAASNYNARAEKDAIVILRNDPGPEPRNIERITALFLYGRDRER